MERSIFGAMLRDCWIARRTNCMDSGLGRCMSGLLHELECRVEGQAGARLQVAGFTQCSLSGLLGLALSSTSKLEVLEFQWELNVV